MSWARAFREYPSRLYRRITSTVSRMRPTPDRAVWNIRSDRTLSFSIFSSLAVASGAASRASRSISFTSASMRASALEM